jgi:hypothetical protein
VGLWRGFVAWVCGMVLCRGYCGVELWYGIVAWVCGVVLWRGFVAWVCGVVLFRGSDAWFEHIISSISFFVKYLKLLMNVVF